MKSSNFPRGFINLRSTLYSSIPQYVLKVTDEFGIFVV